MKALIERVEGEITPFVESQCAVGGSYCEAWHDWFWASADADPACNDEDRDPKPLTDFPFEVGKCFDVARCRLRAAALRAQSTGENDRVED
ncbi:hypothetical protein [Sphingopyxis macrogoltabida]|uniref:Uncharacterized protein n=1 Tax=Sphingopyxis macrogoltabida TaxID=33050 RepID=A0A0N9V2E7_SPHMC|nr:hypothetical protein [Sphingopyxis macrogoltabida]ALH82945.1 hypothetical protein AN936_22080 [Sphingopyxis macrogoltabida]